MVIYFLVTGATATHHNVSMAYYQKSKMKKRKPQISTKTYCIPFIYFVMECRTISAPKSKGLFNENLHKLTKNKIEFYIYLYPTWKYGVIKVLSTTVMIFVLQLLAMSQIAFMSQTFSKGFVGLSIHISCNYEKCE